MSVARWKIELMDAATLLAFEAAHPGWSSNKEMRIRHELGLTPPRYIVLLERAAASREGQAADPVTAHRVTGYTPARCRWPALAALGPVVNGAPADS